MDFMQKETKAVRVIYEEELQQINVILEKLALSDKTVNARKVGLVSSYLLREANKFPAVVEEVVDFITLDDQSVLEQKITIKFEKKSLQTVVDVIKSLTGLDYKIVKGKNNIKEVLFYKNTK